MRLTAVIFVGLLVAFTDTAPVPEVENDVAETVKSGVDKAAHAVTKARQNAADAVSSAEGKLNTVVEAVVRKMEPVRTYVYTASGQFINAIGGTVGTLENGTNNFHIYFHFHFLLLEGTESFIFELILSD
nr:unnamed protein product [Haemonchus contortus]